MNRKALLLKDFVELKLYPGQLYNNNSYKVIPLSYGQHYESCYIQLPVFTHTYEIIPNTYFDELLVALEDVEILDILMRIDNRIITIINEMKEKLFNNYPKIKYKNIVRYKDNKSILKLKIDHNTILRKRIGVISINNLGNCPTEVIKKDDLNLNDQFRVIIQVVSIWISENVCGLYLRPIIIEKLELAKIEFQEEKNNNDHYSLSESSSDKNVTKSPVKSVEDTEFNDDDLTLSSE